MAPYASLFCYAGSLPDLDGEVSDDDDPEVGAISMYPTDSNAM